MTQNNDQENPMKAMRELWTRAATDPRGLVLLAVVLFCWNLWGYDLWAPNEPFFGEGAREMIADGKWLVPHINGELNTHKPPVFFWLIALLSTPLGAVSSFTARLPSVLAALGSLLLTLRLGRRTSGRRTAVLAGAILLTTHMFWDKARSAQIDALLSFLVLVAVSAFEAWRAGDLNGRRAGIVFWLAAAVATLAKGPVGVAVPLGIALVTLAFDRKLGSWRDFAPLSGPLVFVAVTGLWAAAASLWGGYSLGGALQEHVVDRAIHGMHHAQPFWYYLKVLPAVMVPWSFLLPGALIYAWRRRRADDRLLLVAGLFVVVFFSIPTEKRDLYILPAAPFFALLMARLVAAVAGWQQRSADSEPASPGASIEAPGHRWVTVPQGIMAAVLLLAAVAAPIAAPRFGDELRVPAFALAAALGLGALGALQAAVRGLALRSVQWSGAALAAGMLVAVSFIYPPLNPSKSGRELATIMRAETAESRAAGRPVLALGLINVLHSVNFYSDGVYLQEVDDPEEVVAALSSGDVTHVLVNEKLLPPLPVDLQAKMHVVYSTRLSRKNLQLLRFDP